VTRDSDGQDGSSDGGYGQRYDAAGHRVGKREFRVNKYTDNFQRTSCVAPLADWGFFVTWHSREQDGSLNGGYGQRYDAAGTRVGKREFQINQYTTDNQEYPSVAALEDGGSIATWRSRGQDGSSYGVYAHRYDNAVPQLPPEISPHNSLEKVRYLSFAARHPASSASRSEQNQRSPLASLTFARPYQRDHGML
jgi:hypothetical protein